MPLDAGARLWDLPIFPLDETTIRLEYRTAIITSEKGKEQRFARRHRPRKSYRFAHRTTRDCYREGLAKLRAYQADPWAVPDRRRGILTTTELAVSGQSVEVAAAPDWAVVGEAVAMQKPGKMDLFTIQSVIGSTISFFELSPSQYPAGSTIMPAEPATARPSLDGSRPLPDLWNLSADFDVRPALGLDLLPPPAPAVFNGREIFTMPPVRLRPVPTANLARIETIDFGYGAVQPYSPWAYNAERMRLDFGPCPLTEAQLLEDVFRRAKGRRGEIYVPTWSKDLIPTAIAPAASNTITVEGDIVATYGASTIYKAIAVQRAGGAWEPQTVSSMQLVGNDTEITIGGTWGADVDPATIRRLSWLPVWRFAGDGLDQVDRAGKTSMSFNLQTIEDL